MNNDLLIPEGRLTYTATKVTFNYKNSSFYLTLLQKKKIFNIMKALVLLILSALLALHANSQTAKDILPASGWQEGWEREDVLFYEGDDLFFLINGGADLYMEFGFLNVAAAEYNHPEKGRFYIEVYRMESDSAAFGAFSVARGGALVKIEPEPWFIYGDKFMHIWQAEYYITISGAALKAKGFSIDYLLMMADLTERIETSGKLPLLFSELYNSSNVDNFAYLMGPLALTNIYSFGFQDIFRVNEAVMLDKGSEKEITFQYSSEDKATEVFEGVNEFMKDSGRFEAYASRSDLRFSATGRRGEAVSGQLSGSRIIVLIITD